jgi:hypothetical protein
LRDHITEGALCLLLYRPPNAQGVTYHRTKYFPAILPDVAQFASRLTRTNILICPGRSDFDYNQRVDITFTLHSDSFFVLEWNSKRLNPTNHLEESTDFRINTTKFRSAARSVDVWTRVGNAQNPASQLLLRLGQLGEVWSLKEVYEVNLRKRKRKEDVLFHSTTLADRCVVHLSDGQRLSVGLRRSAASARSRQANTTPQLKYQIVVKSLDGEAG